MNRYRKTFAAFIILLQFFVLHAGETLNNLNTTWSVVLPGKVITDPAVTSYGFSVITDSRLVSTYSSSGKLLWEKSVPGYRNAQIFALSDDFILLYSKSDNTISLLNPSGVNLWTKELNYSLTNAPLCGWDGRFFITGSNTLECLGITGVTKWKTELSGIATIPLQTLPDGSIIVFLSGLQDGKTKGLRISPFGETLEEIIFAGQVINAATNTYGVFLNFSDGSAGFFSLEDNISKNKWVLQNNNGQSSGSTIPLKARFLVTKDKQEVFYVLPYTRSVVFYKLNPISGQILGSFTINDIDSNTLNQIVYNKSGLFISDDKHAFFLSDSGIELWSGNLPAKQNKTNWNYSIYTADNHLVICNTNWTLNSYRVSQATSKKFFEKKTQNYNNWYTIDTSDFEYLFHSKIDGEVVSDRRIASVKKGNYGKAEIDYVSELMSACEVYKNNLNSSAKTNKTGPSLFDVDSIGAEHIIVQTTLYSSDAFTGYTAFFIKKLQNKTILNSLLKGIGEFGYDPDGSVLAALEVLSKKVSYKDEAVISGICNAVYSICNFMGRPAFNSKGKDILQNFLFPNYSATTRTTARETLKKISALDL